MKEKLPEQDPKDAKEDGDMEKKDPKTDPKKTKDKPRSTGRSRYDNNRWTTGGGRKSRSGNRHGHGH